MTSIEIRTELHRVVCALPWNLSADCRDMVPCPLSVMRDWTQLLPLRHQGVLVTAVRGCDGAPKEDVSKSFSRMIRRAILNPADDRETRSEGGFFGFRAERLLKDFNEFLHSLDQYPLHYVMHLCHAAEVIGYKHPDEPFRDFFALAYLLMVDAFHLKPETEQEMDLRLTVDRVAAGTTERNF